MGIILLAKCDCGFSEEFRADRGKIVSGSTCYAPALCENCNAIRNLNYAKRKKKCPTCRKKVVFYNDDSLQKPDKEAELIRWGMDIKDDFILPKVRFKCPKCKKFSLKFYKVGNWD